MKFKGRLIFLILGITAFVVAYSLGGAMDMSKEEAKKLKTEFDNNEMKNIDRNKIFLNNLVISLEMFIPGFGTGFGIFVGYSTGFASNAIAEESANHLSRATTFEELVKPFGLLEVFAYGLSISRSAMIIFPIMKKQRKLWKQYFVFLFIEIAIVVLVLLIAATWEWDTITQL